MEFIHHQVTQNPGLVVLPEALHMGLNQQVVELLVVGEQDVGRGLVQGVFIGDDALGCHRCGGGVIGGTDVEASPQARE